LSWGDVVPEWVCPDLGAFGAGSSAARASAVGVSIPGGLSEAAIAVDGSGGAPNVVVTAPNGEQVSGGPGVAESGRFRVTPSPEASRTYVQIADPPAGTYQVDVQPGSVPIATVSTARSLPEPSVKASVRGRGRKRSLGFRVRTISDQRVTFAEQAGGLYRELGNSAKARGTLKFNPAPGPGGRRSIVAIVEQDGVPRARLTVARYKAPTARVRRPRRQPPRRRLEPGSRRPRLPGPGHPAPRRPSPALLSGSSQARPQDQGTGAQRHRRRDRRGVAARPPTRAHREGEAEAEAEKAEAQGPQARSRERPMSAAPGPRRWPFRLRPSTVECP
jgi:hypothetical protein